MFSRQFFNSTWWNVKFVAMNLPIVYGHESNIFQFSSHTLYILVSSNFILSVNGEDSLTRLQMNHTQVHMISKERLSPYQDCSEKRYISDFKGSPTHTLVSEMGRL